MASHHSSTGSSRRSSTASTASSSMASSLFREGNAMMLHKPSKQFPKGCRLRTPKTPLTPISEGTIQRALFNPFLDDAASDLLSECDVVSPSEVSEAIGVAEKRALRPKRSTPSAAAATGRKEEDEVDALIRSLRIPRRQRLATLQEIEADSRTILQQAQKKELHAILSAAIEDSFVPEMVPDRVVHKRPENIYTLTRNVKKWSLRQLVVIEFYAPWCTTCKQWKAKLDYFATVFPQVRFIQLDVGGSPLAGKFFADGSPFLVESLPTFTLWSNGVQELRLGEGVDPVELCRTILNLQQLIDKKNELKMQQLSSSSSAAASPSAPSRQMTNYTSKRLPATPRKRPMNKRRTLVVQRAFALLDKEGRGEVSVRELCDIFDCTRHPSVTAKNWSEEDFLLEFFMARWDKVQEGNVAWAEFAAYYDDLSALIPEDDMFECIVKRAWKLDWEAPAARR